MNPLIKQITIELNGEKTTIDLPQDSRLGDFVVKNIL